MGEFILRTGDSISVTIPAPAVVPALEGPVPLQGSGGSVTAENMTVCLLGDELPAELRQPLPYTAPPFTVPGTGTLTVTLTPANQTAQTRSGKPILIKGGAFTAMFTVTAPATQPTPAGPISDPVTEKPGTAQFITQNATVRAG